MKVTMRKGFSIVGFLFFCYACCPPFCPPDPPPPEPELGLEIVYVSNPTPEIGEEVTIKWEYDHPELLKIQAVRLISLLIDGNLFQQVQGCLPDRVRPEGLPNSLPCMPLNQRAVSFPFKGPVTVSIVGIDADDKVFEKAVKLKLAGMFFKVNEMRFDVAGYPKFGPSGIQRILNCEFDKAFGIYEEAETDPDEDKRINAFLVPPFSQIFAEEKPFFGVSWRPNEAEHFGFIKGSWFPPLNVSFLESDDGRPFRGGAVTNADGLLYAGTIVISGTKEELKTDYGDIVVYTPSSGGYEPFFIQIDFRSPIATTGQSTVCDIHAGNPSQGLVLSVFHGHIDAGGRQATTGDWIFEVSGYPIAQSHGHVKGAVMGFNITTISGDFYTPAQGVIYDMEWAGIPLYPDTDISGLYYDQFVNQN